MHKAAAGYKSKHGLEFTTKFWQVRFVQNLISQLKKGRSQAQDDVLESCDSDSDN